MTLQLAVSNKVNSKKIAWLAAPSDLRQPGIGLLYFLLRKACGDWEFDALQSDMLMYNKINFLKHFEKFSGSLYFPYGAMRWAGL